MPPAPSIENSTLPAADAARPQIRASVRELARRLDVSIATVSRALNGHPEVAPDTRDRVLELAESLNYQRPKKIQEIRTIGLVYPSSPVVRDFGSFESALLGGVMQGLREQRYLVTIVDLEHERLPDESYLELFRRRGIRAALVRTIFGDHEFARQIAAEGIPAVLVADRTDDPTLGFIYCDSRVDSRHAVDHLVHLGHQRIGLIPHFQIDADHRDRIDGYREGLERNGIAFDEDLVEPARGGGPSGGAQALDALLQKNDPPTAVYVTNPLPSSGVLHRCLELGIRVPDEFSVVGFDDSDMRLRTYPQMTAVCQDAQQMGFEAARWISRYCEGLTNDLLRDRRLTHLANHASTGPAPSRVLRLAADRTSIIRAL